MADRDVFRLGSVAAIVGAVVALVTNLLHPRVSDFDNYAAAELLMVAESGGWVAIHLGLLAGSLLIIFGLFAVARSLKGGPGDGWARLALGSLLIAAPIVVVTLMVDGYAVKSTADATFGGAELVAVEGSAVLDVGWALFMTLVLTFLGITPIAFGVALVADRTYPAVLAWPAVALGAAAIVDGTVGTLTGPSAGFFVAFIVTSALLTFWVLLLGVALGRRARQGA